MDTSHSQPPLPLPPPQPQPSFPTDSMGGFTSQIVQDRGGSAMAGQQHQEGEMPLYETSSSSSIPNVVVLGMPMIMEGSPHPHSSTTQTQSSVNLFPHASPHLTSTTSSHLTQNSPSSSSHHDLFHLLVPSAQASVAVSASPISPSSASPFQLQFPGSPNISSTPLPPVALPPFGMNTMTMAPPVIMDPRRMAHHHQLLAHSTPSLPMNGHHMNPVHHIQATGFVQQQHPLSITSNHSYLPMQGSLASAVGSANPPNPQNHVIFLDNVSPTNSNHPDRLRSLTASSLLSASSTSSTASTDSENLAFITFQNLTQTSNEPLYPLFSQTPYLPSHHSLLHQTDFRVPSSTSNSPPSPPSTSTVVPTHIPPPNPLPDHAFDALRGFVDIQIPPKSSPSSADPQAAKPSLSPNTTDTEAPTRGRKRQAPPPTPSSTSSTPSLTPNLFPCPDCPKSFPTRPKLRDHRRCHNRTRSHICPQPGCGKRFLRTQDLARHEATHLLPGEKRFVCVNGGCGKRFGRIDAAKRHARLSCGKRGDGREDEELSVMEEDLGGVSEE